MTANMPEYTPDELLVVVKYLERITVGDLDGQKDACDMYTALDKLKMEVERMYDEDSDR